MDNKWKFIHNGHNWWLRIETVEQLTEYIRQTSDSQFGESMIRVAKRNQESPELKGHYTSQMDSAIDSLWHFNGGRIYETVGKVMIDCHSTYHKLLNSFGFININNVGGCNSTNYPIKIVEYRDNLIFPTYDESDIIVKTWEWNEKKNGIHRPNDYTYHWYAYLGGIQIKDGDKEKWDTKEEAFSFAKTLL